MKIIMARGDIKRIRFTVKLGKEIQTNFDNVYFTVKKRSDDKNYKFQKKLSDGTITENDGHFQFSIDPEDTNDLSFSDYVFDIEIVKSIFVPVKYPGKVPLTVSKILQGLLSTISSLLIIKLKRKVLFDFKNFIFGMSKT